ncbi:N-acetyl-gamma-glutamyl-phosphate reductase [Pseudoalteromonas byunsanensis]|nr:N-acetyl-gamma-glutamyl-phosphate reductase [Pseudoalteromonas byunsanensis]
MGIKVAIVGSNGLSGGELCRLLLNHPQVDKIYPLARKELDFDIVHPNLLGCGLRFYKQEELQEHLSQIDVVFFCTPTGEAMKSASYFLSKNIKVIDLSADFRFPDAELYKQAHGQEHEDLDNLSRAVYGVSEFNADKLRQAQLIANPGCYVITALLGLAPLMGSALVDAQSSIHISAINGTSGAGASLKPEVMHSYANNNILPYNLDGHRHAPELEHQLSLLADQSVNVVFSTAHGAFPRGIYIQASISVPEHVANTLTREQLLKEYVEYYGKGAEGHYFVRILDHARVGKLNSKQYNIYPSVARVAGSNFCHIGVDFDTQSNTIKVISVTDNLVKGAAGSAIQNMNLAFGFEEHLGLSQFGL